MPAAPGRRVLLLTCLVPWLLAAGSAWAFAPDVLFWRTYTESGWFVGVVFDDSLNPPRQVVLGGTATEGTYQFYAVRVDTAGDPLWTRLYGNADRCEAVMRAADGHLQFLGYTTANPTVDYRMMRLLSNGQRDGNWSFGGNTTADYGLAMAERPAGSLCITGRKTPGTSGASDAPLLRISTDAVVSWSQTLTQAGAGEAVEFASDTALFVFATSDSIAADSLSGADIIVFRTDTLGLVRATKRFRVPGEQACAGAVRFSDSLTIVVGATKPWGSGARYWDLFLVATNDSLDSLWSRSFGTTMNDWPVSAAATLDLDSGMVVAGWSDMPGTGDHGGRLWKFSRSGDSLWTLAQPEQGYGEFSAATQDAAYRYHVAGRARGAVDHGLYLVTEPDPHSPGPHPPAQFSLLAPQNHDTITSDSAVFSWETAADPDSADTVRYSLKLAFDTLFAGSHLRTFGPLNGTRFVWRNDTDDVRVFWRVEATDLDSHVRVCRERQWDFRLSVPDSTRPFSLVFPDSGQMLPQPFSAFRWRKAYDPDVNDTIRYTIRFLAADTGFSMAGLRDTFITVNFANNPLVGPGDTVTWYVTATSRIPPMAIDSRERWTFVLWVDESGEVVAVPLEFALAPPFPNPFNTSVTIRFSLDRTEDIRLDVFDVLGRRVRTLASGVHTAGPYTLPWDGSGEGGAAASGMYFVRLTAGVRERTVKLTMIR